MKNRHIKLTAIIILIFSIIVFLWNGFLLFLGCISENREIEINDYNFMTIDEILYQSIASYDEIPDISNATKIEYIMLMHKDKVTIYYEDKTEHIFFIVNGYENLFTQYMKENGSILYFKSPEFIFDLVKVVASFSILIVCIVILIKHRVCFFGLCYTGCRSMQPTRN